MVVRAGGSSPTLDIIAFCLVHIVDVSFIAEIAGIVAVALAPGLHLSHTTVIRFLPR